MVLTLQNEGKKSEVEFGEIEDRAEKNKTEESDHFEDLTKC